MLMKTIIRITIYATYRLQNKGEWRSSEEQSRKEYARRWKYEQEQQQISSCLSSLLHSLHQLLQACHWHP